MRCTNCGSTVTLEAKFCPECGQAVAKTSMTEVVQRIEPVQKTTHIDPQSHAKSSPLACPICDRDDQVMKVTAIVSGQTHEIRGGSYSTQTYVDSKGKKQNESHYVPFSGTQQSILAEEMSPPSKPNAGWNTCGLISLALGIWFGIWLILIGGFASGNTMPGFVLIGIGFVVYLTTESSRQEKVNQVQQTEIPIWENAIQRWSQLYYCYRDDIVFIPGEDEAIPKSRLTAYIYQSSFSSTGGGSGAALTNYVIIGSTITEVEKTMGKPHKTYIDDKGRMVYEYPTRRFFISEGKVGIVEHINKDE